MSHYHSRHSVCQMGPHVIQYPKPVSILIKLQSDTTFVFFTMVACNFPIFVGSYSFWSVVQSRSNRSVSFRDNSGEVYGRSCTTYMAPWRACWVLLHVTNYQGNGTVVVVTLNLLSKWYCSCSFYFDACNAIKMFIIFYHLQQGVRYSLLIQLLVYSVRS